ncbi:hypothetical protein KBB17_02180 [Candidatus Saccharibacteria bacterium]|jgi:phosphoribosylformylglycinamidine cyclo-ligase|nr:hypothetical protein [Candidatus Saccharibacteria bacterium]MBP9132278.1 hypothetical protein [Candidatus Saccharibacteria bacterium]
MTNYADAGVDVDIEAQAAKIFYEAAKTTWKNRENNIGQVTVPFDDFSGSRSIHVGQLPAGTFMNIGFDTVGTKAEIAQRVGRHDTIAYDLVAMVADDAVVRGAEPVIMGSNLETNSIGSPENNHLDIIRQLAKGYAEAANIAGVAITNGETAQIGDAVSGYGEFNYNWGASLAWFATQSRMFNGTEIQPGDTLIGLAEPGIRCNGISLARKILSDIHGEQWHEVPFATSTFGEELLRPSIIYSRAITEMFGGWNKSVKPAAEIHGVAHITGGGLPEKVGRMFKNSRYGAGITDTFAPNEMTLFMQEFGKVSDREAYRTWNMGQGMVIATPDPSAVFEVAKKHNLEAKIVGTVVTDHSVRINSQGFNAGREGQLSYPIE